MILIGGDSWGCGEFPDPKTASGDIDYQRLVGLGSYYKDDGHEVINFSAAGGSNLRTLEELKLVLQQIAINGRIKDIKNIFLFQTEWHRDFRMRAPGLEGFVTLKDSHYIPNNYNQEFVLSFISRWQHQLSEIAQLYNVRIGIIGGCSDTMWLSKFEEEYPGLYIACQSVTNLCISNNDKIDTPVFSVSPDTKFVELCKKYDTEFLLTQLDLGRERISQWLKHPEWFWPDGGHANQKAHRHLYEFLRK